MGNEYVMTKEAWYRLMVLDLQQDMLGPVERHEFEILKNMYLHDISVAKERVKKDNTEANNLMAELTVMADVINKNL